ncbi:hypothetical protein [Candidatus Liberibacter sp.]|uniref:hypothetical protein n=1 Tax=Candidatus Liberibacter sp. TaxID=34022 RepID=UPI0015F61275|nr:hypothetical protein [Candidatus Liberibacter sp.]MBA5724285.1 hypothetical protein [Candidatus Liberibacter sp.]
MSDKQTIEEYRIASLEKHDDKLDSKVDSSIRDMTKAFANLRVDVNEKLDGI